MRNAFLRRLQYLGVALTLAALALPSRPAYALCLEPQEPGTWRATSSGPSDYVAFESVIRRLRIKVDLSKLPDCDDNRTIGYSTVGRKTAALGSIQRRVPAKPAPFSITIERMYTSQGWINARYAPDGAIVSFRYPPHNSFADAGRPELTGMDRQMRITLAGRTLTAVETTMVNGVPAGSIRYTFQRVSRSTDVP